MGDELTYYELEVLQWHREKPRKRSANDDRKEAQEILVSLHYLTRSEEGMFSITAKGLKRLSKSK
jgi:hypothetical protein